MYISFVKTILITILALLPNLDAYAAVSNVRFSLSIDDQIIIEYDLEASRPCTVSIEVSFDGGTSFPVKPISIKGDIGKNIMPGTGKSIVWQVFRDIKLPKRDMLLKVIANDGSGEDQKQVPIAAEIIYFLYYIVVVAAAAIIFYGCYLVFIGE